MQLLTAQPPHNISYLVPSNSVKDGFQTKHHKYRMYMHTNKSVYNRHTVMFIYIILSLFFFFFGTLFVAVFGKTNGHMQLQGIPPGYHTLRVSALRGPTTNNNDNNKVVISRQIHFSEDLGSCSVYLINDGLSVSGNVMSVQFKGIPAANLPYRCRLDDKPNFNCEL